MNICYNPNDTYCQHTAVSLASLLENNKNSKEINVYILCENVSEKNKEKFKKLTDNYPNTALKIIDCSDLIDISKSRFNTGAWKKSYNYLLYIYAGSLFPDIDKILWLDGDIIITDSLEELWNTDIENYVLGAALDCPPFMNFTPDEPFWTTPYYFNAGSLLINLRKFRELDIEKKCQQTIFCGKNPLRFLDQSIYNLSIKPELVKRLDLKYNFPVGISDAAFIHMTKINNKHKPTFTLEEYKKSSRERTILHFIGGSQPEKPWFIESNTENKALYLKYLNFTPWKGTPLKSYYDCGGSKAMKVFSKGWDTAFSAVLRKPFHNTILKNKVKKGIL